MPVQVLVMERHEAIRAGLRVLFASSDMEIAAESCDLRENVDVALVSVERDEEDGWATVRRIKASAPWLPVVTFAPDPSRWFDRYSRLLGAEACLVKGMDGRDLVAALRAASRTVEIWRPGIVDSRAAALLVVTLWG